MSIRSFDKNATIIAQLESAVQELKASHATLQDIVLNGEQRTWTVGVASVRDYDTTRGKVDRLVHSVFQASNLLDDEDSYLKDVLMAEKETDIRASGRDD